MPCWRRAKWTCAVNRSVGCSYRSRDEDISSPSRVDISGIKIGNIVAIKGTTSARSVLAPLGLCECPRPKTCPNSWVNRAVSVPAVHGVTPRPTRENCLRYGPRSPSAPAVHDMIVALERRGLISRVPRQPRTIRLLLSADELPALQPIKITAARY